MKKYAILFLFWFPILSNASDYFVVGTTNQVVAIDAYKRIEIDCYCSNNVEIIKYNEPHLQLEIYGEESSVGYHGNQESPKEVRTESMRFTIGKSKDTLILSSKEWTYIHHAFFIKKLVVSVPESVQVVWTKIKGRDLEGRGN